MDLAHALASYVNFPAMHLFNYIVFTIGKENGLGRMLDVPLPAELFNAGQSEYIVGLCIVPYERWVIPCQLNDIWGRLLLDPLRYSEVSVHQTSDVYS